MVFYKITFSKNYNYNCFVLYYNHGVTSYYECDWNIAAMQFDSAIDFYKEYRPSNYTYLIKLYRLVLYCSDRYHNITKSSISKSLVDSMEKKIQELQTKIKIRGRWMTT